MSDAMRDLRRSLCATALFALLATGGPSCQSGSSGGGGSAAPYLRVGLTLPQGFPTDKIAAADILIAPLPGEPDPAFPPGSSFLNVGGINVTVKTQVENGHRELLVSYSQSPFPPQALSADLYLYARLTPFADGGGSVHGPKLQVSVRLYTPAGDLLASGQSSAGTDGQPIRFGPEEKSDSVDIVLACAAGAVCDSSTPAIAPGRGIARVTVTRARDCPTQAYEGDLYVLLFPGSQATTSGSAITQVQRGVNFSAEDTSVTLDLPQAVAGSYWAVAVHDIRGDLPQQSFTPASGDLTSDGRPIDIVTGRTTTVSLVLNQVVDIGRCSGGVPRAPVAPTLTGSSPQSPSSSNDLQLLGTAAAGSTVRIYTDPACNSPVAGEGTADALGAFQVAVTVADNSTTIFHATATDALGYVSPCSPSRLTYVHDNIPPDPPEVLGTTPDSPSNQTEIVVSGIAEAAATVSLYAGPLCDDAPLASGAADVTGVFRITVQVPVNSVTNLFATDADAAGNVSACSSSYATYVADGTAPAAPSGLSTAPSSPANENTPTVTGTAEPDAVVRLYLDPACTVPVDGVATADASGRFLLSVAVADNSTSTFYAQATDAAGNVSPCSADGVIYVEDSHIPEAPILSSTSPPSPGRSNTPVVFGTAEEGSTVRIYVDAACTVLASQGSAAELGTAGILVVVAVNQTTPLYATATNAAGNVSACSATAVSYTQDSTPPAAPAALATSPPSPANNLNPAVSGTAEPGSLVALYKDAVCTGDPATTGTASQSGDFRIAVAVSASTTFYAAASDAAGNVSPCSAPLAYVLDTTPPAVAGVTVIDGTSGDTAFQSSTGSLSASWSGFGDASGLTYEYNVSTSPACTGDVVPTANMGTATSKTTSGLTLIDGRTYYNCVRAIDAAGNPSAWVASNGVTIDTSGPTAPGSPSATAGNRQVLLSWAPSADPGSGVASYEVASCTPRGCTLPSSPQLTGITTTSVGVPALANCTEYAFAVRARDNAGNAGPYSTVAFATATLPAPGQVLVVPGAGSAELSFAPVPNASDYEICADIFAGQCAAVFPTGGRTATRVTGLPPGTADFSVRAKDGTCTGPASVPVHAPTFDLTLRYQRTGALDGQRLGSSLAPLGDADGDGQPDFVVSASGSNSAFVYSGASGRLLYTKIGPSFGGALATAGDVNGDGKGDFITRPRNGSGAIYIYSGVDGTLLRQKTGGGSLEEFGAAFASVGHFKVDGRSDVAISDVVYSRGEVGPGNPLSSNVFVYSGSTGALLSSIAVPVSAITRLASLGDLDGDGRGDLAVVRSCTYGCVSIVSSSGVPLFDLAGESAGDGFGSAVASAGDVDGDGTPDFILGAPGGCGVRGCTNGKAYVYSGADGSLLYRMQGETVGDRFGSSVGSAGDLDGDGKADFIVSAPDLAVGAAYVGRAYIYSGADGTLLYQLDGAADGDGFGTTLAVAGEKLVVGATGVRSGTLYSVGAVYAFAPTAELRIQGGESIDPSGAQGYGPTGTPVVAITSTGRQLSASGGTPPYTWTLLTAATGNDAQLSAAGRYLPGTAQLAYDTLRVTDAVGRSRDTRIAAFDYSRGVQANPGLVSSLADVGDLDADGRSDYLVGLKAAGSVVVCSLAPSNQNTPCGASGDGTELSSLYGQGGDEFGAAVAGLRDINGDGKPDFAVGAPATTSQTGAVYVYSGANFAVLFPLTGNTAGDRFGAAVASAGDVDGDGTPDVLVGATGAGGTGKAYVYSGRSGALLRTMSGETSGDLFGSTVLSADLNGDGIPDLLVGAPGALSGTGKVYAYSGEDGSPPLFQIAGTAAGAAFGSAIAVADFTGDGRPDLAIGAPQASPGGQASAGSVYVYSGAVGTPFLVQANGQAAGDQFGTALAVADFDRDGHPDLVVAAPNAAGTGTVYVYSGADASLMNAFAAGSPGDRVGTTVVVLGETNADGIPDLLFSDGVQRVYAAFSLLPVLALGRPTRLVAAPVSSTRVVLAWTRNSRNETGFVLELRRFAGAWAPAPSQPAAGTTLFFVDGLAPNTTYSFRLKAQSATGDSLWSPVATATTTVGP
jgi:hypothetical protein